jgi:hypothetical protein
MSVDSTGATVTANPLEETGGISTGGIVGSVAGGLAALAILGFIVAWLLVSLFPLFSILYLSLEERFSDDAAALL